MTECRRCGGQIVWFEGNNDSVPGGNRRAGFHCEACGHEVCAMCGSREIEVDERYCFKCSEELLISRV